MDVETRRRRMLAAAFATVISIPLQGLVPTAATADGARKADFARNASRDLGGTAFPAAVRGEPGARQAATM